MASAIGNAAAKATTIVKVNAVSKFTSGRTLSIDMLLAPPRGRSKSRHRYGAPVAPRTLCPEGTAQWCPEMVNRALMAARGRL
jgi:hypothetical protein